MVISQRGWFKMVLQWSSFPAGKVITWFWVYRKFHYRVPSPEGLYRKLSCFMQHCGQHSKEWGLALLSYWAGLNISNQPELTGVSYIWVLTTETVLPGKKKTTIRNEHEKVTYDKTGNAKNVRQFIEPDFRFVGTLEKHYLSIES